MLSSSKRNILIVGYGQDGKILHNKLQKKKIKTYIIINKKKKISKKNTFIKILNIKSKSQVFSFLKNKNNLDIYFLATHNISSTQRENDDLFLKNYNSNVLALINFLEFMDKNRKKNFKLFYASSSHIFEDSKIYPQNEKTTKLFRSNYALVKYLGLKVCEYYRFKKRIFCSAGILYTHVSKHISKNFLIKELANKIKKKNTKVVFVKNLNTKIDIMSAYDAVDLMQLILLQKKPDTFIISSGKLTTIKEIFSSIIKFYKIKHKIILKNKSKIKKNNFYLFGNNKKLSKRINLKSKIDIDEIVSQVLN
tara:strand:+ start:4461 stop:5384 length:924 start_codon:yes stop_codon:yes gene_type:complete